MLPERLQQMEANADQMIQALSEGHDPDEVQGDVGSVAENQDAAEYSSDAGQTDGGVAPAATSDIAKELEALKQQAYNADQRWRSLQGMMDKKDQENESLRNLLAQLSERKQPEPQSVSQHLKPEDREQFGEELMDAAYRAGLDAATKVVESLRKEVIAPLLSRLDGLSQATTAHATSSFEDRLASRVPDWQQLNVDAGFNQWLAGKAPYSRKPRLEVLREAYANMDLDAVVEFFSDYKAAQAPAQSEPKPQADKFVSPGRPKSTPTKSEAQPNGKVWTGADITKLYEDDRKKRITKDEFERLERDLFKAQAEGRVAY